MPGRQTAEQIFRGMLRGPVTTVIGNTNPWAFKLLSVTTATTSVATTVVDSDSLIFLSIQGPTAAASLASRSYIVTSINPGVGITLQTTDGAAPAATYHIMGLIFRTQ